MQSRRRGDADGEDRAIVRTRGQAAESRRSPRLLPTARTSVELGARNPEAPAEPVRGELAQSQVLLDMLQPIDDYFFYLRARSAASADGRTHAAIISAVARRVWRLDRIDRFQPRKKRFHMIRKRPACALIAAKTSPCKSAFAGVISDIRSRRTTMATVVPGFGSDLSQIARRARGAAAEVSADSRTRMHRARPPCRSRIPPRPACTIDRGCCSEYRDREYSFRVSAVTTARILIFPLPEDLDDA